MTDDLSALAKRYERSPVLRGLIQLIPHGIGSAFDSTVQALITGYETRRLDAFFEQLESASVQLSPHLIESDDFLHCYFTTIRATLRARRRQKARYLARLLAASFDHGRITSPDEYDELLGIIDELSYRELLVLAILARYERDTPRDPSENEFQRSEHYWNDFVKEITERAELAPELVDGFLLRLVRTGCYELFSGYLTGPIGGRGKLTGLYFRLEKVAGSFAEVAA